MRKTILTKVISLFLCLIFSQGAWAVVFNVTTAEEFQAALTTAASNGGDDEILLAPGVYVGNFKYTARESFDLTVRAELASDRAVLDGAEKNFALGIWANQLSFSVKLSDLILRNGSSLADGGGLKLYDLDGPFEVRNSQFDKNIAPRGSGFFAENVRSVLVENTVFTSNAGVEAGAVTLMRTPRVELSQVVFDSNRALQDTALHISTEGVYDVEERIVIIENEFLRNESTNGNKVISIHAMNAGFGGSLGVTFSNSLFSGNLGQLLYIESYTGSETLEFRNNTFKNNDCLNRSQALVFHSLPGRYDKKILIEGNTFFKNSCETIVLSTQREVPGYLDLSIRNNLFDQSIVAEGRIAPVKAQNVEIVNNTWVDGGFGQGLDLDFARETILNVSNNIFSDDLTVTLRNDFSFAKLSNNIFGNAEPIGFWDSATSNSFIDPKFFNVENSDFRLAKDSPALDAGTNEAVTDPDATDLDGNPRILNGTVDIGAYERNTAPLHPADTNGDNVMSLEEFNAYNEAWRANDTWPTPPNEIPIDYVTRAGYLLQKGGEYKNIGVGKPLTWVPVSE